jgi:5'(3')-deoxyribonucleotidase
MTARRRIVGVDIDGVLGNQVHGVLERVKGRLGRSITYEQVVHWDLPLGDSSLVPEIKAAMNDATYVLTMPVHHGAREMLTQLRQTFVVKLITVRPPTAMQWTEEWLQNNDLPYDELIRGSEALKSRHGAHALVDDYPRNLAEFLRNTEGFGVLVDQPWNQDLDELGAWLETSRLARMTNLLEVPRWLAAALA